MPNYFTELQDGPSGPSYEVKDKEAQSSITAMKNGSSIDSFGDVETALAGKVDKVEGKGLSTNDYSDTEKGKVADNTSAIEAVVNEYGAKNLLPTVRSGSKNGAIFTVNADGSFTITGNPTEYTPFTLYNDLNLTSGQYVLSGIPSGGGADKWGINCEVDGTWLPNSVWQGGATSYNINVSSIISQVTLIVYPKTGGDYNLTFYPMIRDARITDPTYVPYTMTNRELTDAVNRGSVSVVADGVKTIQQLLSDLYSAISYSKLVSNKTTVKLIFGNAILSLVRIRSHGLEFSMSYAYDYKLAEIYCYIGSDTIYSGAYYNDVYHDQGNDVPTSGTVYTIVY